MRFDGLALLAALAAGAIGYLLIALAGVAMAMLRPPGAARARRIARAAASMGLATLVGFGLFFAWWAGTGTLRQGPGWLDLMIFPWLAVFLAGCLTLTRR